MSARTNKLLLFIALLVYGIGHLQDVVSGLGVKNHRTTPNVSRLLKRAGERADGGLSGVNFMQSQNNVI